MHRPPVALPDWSDEQTLRHPYAAYRQLATGSPVTWSPELDAWVVASDELVRALLMDRRLSARGPHAFMSMLPPEALTELADLRDFYDHWMVFSDPPYHAQLRSRLLQDWSPRRMESYRPLVAERIAALADPLRDKPVDAVAALARPLANAVARAVLGIAADEADRVQRWAADIIGFIVTPRPVPELGRAALASVRELTAYATDLAGRDGHVLAPAAELGPTAVAATFAQLLTGGSDPLAAALASAVDALAAEPAEHRRLCRGEVDAGEAVEELLRLACPFTQAPRVARTDLDVDGQPVHKGQMVLLLLSAANRDPARFPHGDAVRLGHPASARQLAFGLGEHYCLGAGLARVVLHELLAYLGRLDGVERAGTARWLPAFGIRTLVELPVRLRTRPG